VKKPDWIKNVRNIHTRIANKVWPNGWDGECGKCGKPFHYTSAQCAYYLAHGWPRCDHKIEQDKEPMDKYDYSENIRRTLLALMCALSEEHYAAGWMEGLEYALWAAVKSNRMGVKSIRYGTKDLSDTKLTYLDALSKACGGWFFWSEEKGMEVFITLDAWEAMYKAYFGH
jgi:hypothetical protein